MSTVKIEPFVFGSEEDGIQLNPEVLPGAIQQEEQEEKPEPKTKVAESKTQTQETPQEEPEEDEDSDDSNSPDPLGLFGGSSKKKGDVEEEKEKLTTDKVDYKAFADFLIETEVWKDFEGRDEIEYNEQTFQALWKAQADNTAREYLIEERSQFGDAANQLIDYLKHGGTVDDFVSNYTQQLDVASIDVSDEDGQERIIKEYYKSLDWSDSKIKKHVERLKDSGESEFREEAEDCKNKLVEAIEAERAEMIREQEEIAQDRRLRAEAFNKAVRDNIYKDPDLAEREKKELDRFIYDYKYQDNNGNRYSEFMVKMNEISQDPRKYQKFIKFVKNIENFEDKKVAEKEAARKTFNFLKEGGNPLAGATSKEPVKQKQTSPPAFKFK
jgi:hypothetical protein